MAETNVTKVAQVAPVAVPVNGTPVAAEPAKRAQKPREVPMIGISADKNEYQEIEAALKQTLGGLNMKVGFGPFVLACALKTIRKEILKTEK